MSTRGLLPGALARVLVTDRRLLPAGRTLAAHVERCVAAHQVSAVLLREPDLVQRMMEDETAESLCVHCNKCMPTIYRGTHCVLVNADRG